MIRYVEGRLEAVSRIATHEVADGGGWVSDLSVTEYRRQLREKALAALLPIIPFDSQSRTTIEGIFAGRTGEVSVGEDIVHALYIAGLLTTACISENAEDILAPGQVYTPEQKYNPKPGRVFGFRIQLPNIIPSRQLVSGRYSRPELRNVMDYPELLAQIGQAGNYNFQNWTLYLTRFFPDNVLMAEQQQPQPVVPSEIMNPAVAKAKPAAKPLPSPRPKIEEPITAAPLSVGRHPVTNAVELLGKLDRVYSEEPVNFQEIGITEDEAWDMVEKAALRHGVKLRTEERYSGEMTSTRLRNALQILS